MGVRSRSPKPASVPRELAARLLELYGPDEELVWQTFFRKQIDGIYSVGMTDEQWSEFIDGYDSHEVSSDDFCIGDFLPDDLD